MGCMPAVLKLRKLENTLGFKTSPGLGGGGGCLKKLSSSRSSRMWYITSWARPELPGDFGQTNYLSIITWNEHFCRYWSPFHQVRSAKFRDENPMKPLQKDHPDATPPSVKTIQHLSPPVSCKLPLLFQGHFCSIQIWFLWWSWERGSTVMVWRLVNWSKDCTSLMLMYDQLEKLSMFL